MTKPTSKPAVETLPCAVLPDLDGTAVDLCELRGDGILVVVFAANHCPYVKRLESAMGVVADDYASRGVSFAAICSNDVSLNSEDDLPGLRAQALRAGWQFPYLVDAEQSVAREFDAACTPDFFVFDNRGRLAYRGAFDDATPGNTVPATGSDLRLVLDELLAGRPAPAPLRRAIGCGIVWREAAPD